MSIQFSCPSCGHAIQVGDQFAGLAGHCKHCGRAMTVPAAPPEAAGLKLTPEVANAHVRRWLDEVANVRVHATTKAVPATRLAEEQAAMLPAPALKAQPALSVRVAIPIESLQHPLAVYDELLGVAA